MSKKRFPVRFDPKLLREIKCHAKQKGYPSINGFIEATMLQELKRSKKRNLILKLKI